MGRFVVDSGRYASDFLDGETIVMDTVNGRLFLLEQGAAVVWGLIAKGVTRESIESGIEARYGAARRNSVEMFLNDLVELGLITEAIREDSISSPDANADWPDALGEFRLTQYDDMTNIITMDPIHDVDPKRGWPFDGRD